MNMRELPSIIAGEKLPVQRKAERISIVNPADESTNGVLLEADPAEVDAAVAAARRAFDDGPWPRMSAAEREPLTG